MPAAFIGHGSPMNALERNRFTTAWRDFGAQRAASPRRSRHQRALVHQRHGRDDHDADLGRFTTSTASPRNCSPSTTRHRDYRNSPKRSPTSFTRRGSVRMSTVGASITARGRCSSTPSRTPSIPVVQLSINADRPLDYHLDLGARLAPLRAENILILGSGNIVHNLASMQWQLADEGFDWAKRFDDAARTQMLHGPDELRSTRRPRRLRHRSADTRPLPAVGRTSPGWRLRRTKPLTFLSTDTPTGRCR